ncbi:MAG: DUF924 domain-containing protein [Phyllobacteriaceae bacterium]|nr:DUF924 domain-containing protein [Phyllobacteriaceae bacterium]
MTQHSADDVLAFWFVEHGPSDWFSANADFDALIAARFADTHAAAARCELWAWRATPRGRIAEILVLDQFSRQMFRGQAQAFAADPLALALAQEAVASGAFGSFDANERQFLLMPFMHAESLAVQEEGVRLFSAHCPEATANFARAHRDTIARFGRFPMRNVALGRESTPAEAEYMAAQAGRMF